MRPIIFMSLVAVAAITLVAPDCRAAITGPEILAKLHAGHPRLMMTPDTIADIKSNLSKDPWLKKRYGKQKGAADDLLNEPATAYTTKGGDGILNASRQVLKRVSTLALVYRIEGDKKYLDRCWLELEAASQFPDWNPRHFLSDAEMTTACAIGYDWLFDSLTPFQRQTLREAIINKGLKPGQFIYVAFPQMWAARNNNWNIVCNGGLAMGALAIADEAPEIAGTVLAQGLASSPLCLSQFAPDGAWGEGPMYWGYMTLYESMYLSSLQTACGTDFGLGDIPGIEKGGWFPAYINGTAGGTFNFADAEEDPEPRSGPQLLWMARRFHEPRYAQYEIDHTYDRLTALEVIWGAGVEHKPWQTIELDRCFHGVEVATMRDSWNDPKGWFVGFKAGSNAVNHSHLDVGTFVLDARGVRWAIALGPDDYDLPGYFDGLQQRWTYYRLRAEGNNTLVVNPDQTPDQAPQGAGKISDFKSTSQGVELSADLTGVYPAAEKVTRALSFVRGKSLQISDVVTLKNPGQIWWFLQTRAQIKPGDDGKTLTLLQDGQAMTLKLLSPDSARFRIGPAEPLASSPHPTTQAVNTGVSRIAIHLADVASGTITVRFE